MKIVVCAGSPGSHTNQVIESLYAAGLEHANESADGQSPQSWFETVVEAYELRGAESLAEQFVPGKLWERRALEILEANIQRGAWGFAASNAVGFLEYWRDLDPSIVFILTYASPELEVAGWALNLDLGSRDIGAMLDLWRAQNTLILRFYNRNRDRSILINAERALADVPRLIELCNAELGLRLTRSDTEVPRGGSLSPLALTLASFTTRERNDLHDLYQELQVTASLPDGESKVQSDDEAWVEYRALVATQRDLVTKLEELERNNQASEASQLALPAGEVSDLSRLSRSELESLETAYQDLQSENDILLTQLLQVQEELESFYGSKQRTTQPEQPSSPPLTAIEGRMRYRIDDLRDKKNWYQCELDDKGLALCWSGPDPRATVMLPIARNRAQLLVIQCRQTVTRSQLEGLHIEIDGVRVAHRVHPKLNPLSIEIDLPPDDRPPSSGTEVAINLPKTYSDSDVNPASVDRRPLGIAVYSFSIVPLEPKLRVCHRNSLPGRLKQASSLFRLGLSTSRFPLSYFDGLAYLQAYPEVLEAVNGGEQPSALAHYITTGHSNRYRYQLADRALPCEGDRYDLKLQELRVQ